MRTIEVSTGRPYVVKIGTDLLPTLGAELAAFGGTKSVCIVSDSNVWPLYGSTAEASLTAAGFTVCSFVFPAGEASKCGETYLNLLNYLAEQHLTRSDSLVALGGGVVGDLTGFAAATFLRGIRFVQVPTTLLAAVDSSVGGKTAIDLHAGKNLAGTFYQPSLVLCDLNTLNTLPVEIFRDGAAEVVKYSFLYDPALYNHLLEHGMDFDREAVVSRCVELKRDVVSEDEFDRGARAKLNLGHTFAHGVEAQSHFAISHGRAVAMGMGIAARSAAKYGICTQETAQAILNLLKRFSLPDNTDFPADALCSSMLSDKKRSGGKISLILPEEIGSCIIHPIPVEELPAYLEAGL